MWYTIVIYIQRVACRRTNAPSGLRTELAGHCPQELDRPGWQVGTSRVATSFIQYHIKQTLEYLAKISWKHDDIGWHINIRISNIIQYQVWLLILFFSAKNTAKFFIQWFCLNQDMMTRWQPIFLLIPWHVEIPNASASSPCKSSASFGACEFWWPCC